MKTSELKTPWFAPSVKPVRPGIYQTRIVLIDGKRPGYSMWDGKQWMNERLTVQQASKDDMPGYQHKEWRGLVKSADEVPA